MVKRNQHYLNPGLFSDLRAPSDLRNKVYKLLQNLYGLKEASRTWYLHLKSGLTKCGWKQSVTDSCLFTKDNVILILYVDDTIIISPNFSMIKACICSLQKDFSLTDDGPLHNYFGVSFIGCLVTMLDSSRQAAEYKMMTMMTLSAPRKMLHVWDYFMFRSS